MASLLLLFSAAADGFSQDAFNWPAQVDPILEASTFGSKSIGPLGYTETFSAKCQNRLKPPIASLFFACCPPAVGRLIVSVVVDSFDLVVSGRSLPHIFQERLKRVSPFSAYRNAPIAVARVSNVAWGFASPDHRPPTRVGGRFGHAVGLAAFGCDFTSNTSTAAFCSFFQTVPICKCFTSTLTSTLPNKQSAFVSSGERHDCQPAELLANSNLTCVISERPLRAFGWINNWLDILRHDFFQLVNNSMFLLYQSPFQESI
jgi:hypothetical protein